MLARFWSSPRNRVLLLLAFSLALHLLILRFSGWSLKPAADEPERLEAVLVPIPPPKTEEPKPLVPPPAPPARHTPQRPPTPTREHPPPPAQALPVEELTTGPSTLVADSEPGHPAEADNGAQPSSPAATPVAPPAAESVPPAPKGDAPAAAILYYDVVGKDPKKDPNQSYVGNGRIDWRLDDTGGYQADLNATASLLFLRFTVLESKSEGQIDAQGLQPSRYTETPRNRTALVTLFRRGQDSVGVSAGSVADVGPGTQDRLSIIFQLGALLRANPTLSTAGAQFAVRVANLKGESSDWTFRVLGLEPVVIDMGKIDAVHVQRVLRAGTNDRRIDVWVALDLGGYPARILYTEPSDAYIDLKLTKIE